MSLSQSQSAQPLSGTRKLWCIIYGESEAFTVSCQTDTYVYGLKKLIQERGKNRIFRNVEANDLILWKLHEPINAQRGIANRLLERITANEGKLANIATELDVTDEVSEVFPEQPAKKELWIIVQRPSDSGTVNDAGEKTEDNRVLNPDLRKEYKDIFIRVKEWGVFEHGDVERNNVRSTSAAPGFVTIFEEMLDTKPLLPPDADIASRYILDDKFRAAYFGTPDESQEENKQPSRYAERLEVMHIGCIASENWEKCSKPPLGKTFKECLANAIFFFRLALHVPDDKVTTAQLGSTAWPFELVIQCIDARPPAELRGYKPRSDLLISKSSLPRLLVEVNSTTVKDWPHDLVRMLLQGAAIVRFANKFVNAFSKKNFVLVAIYIYDDGRAIRQTSRSWVILPKMDTVADYLAFTPDELYSEVTRVCWGLIKGLAYLHENYIAHRDIKPDNLVVNQDFCLKIIDFDIAMQVKGEDEEFDDSCGTKGWMAPEVEKELYSPIRADRWSCGRVLLFVLDESRKEDKLLRAIAGKLKAHDPKRRPSLNEWHRWTAAPALAGNVVKITRIRQDTMEINGDNRNAKRQKLIES